MEKINLIIEKWNKSNAPYDLVISKKNGNVRFESLSEDMLIGKIIKELEKFK